MKITRGMIDKELRFTGRVHDLLTGMIFSTENRIRRSHRRAQESKDKPTLPAGMICEEVFAERADGTPLRLCVFRSAKTAANATGVLWIHGGGYAAGSPEQHAVHCESMLSAANCVIVAPDYTLSPEKPYPAALEDCYSALVWMKEHADGLGVNTDQLFVTGVSAGGGLTAAVTLYARDQGDVNIAFQMPLYPMIDCDMKRPSAVDNNAPIWNSKRNALAWRLYLGELYGTPDVPKYASPMKETDYAGLPPAYTFIGDLDPFYDETLAYFENLKEAGVPAEVDVYQGCYHAFEMLVPQAEVSRRAQRGMIEAFVYAVGNYFAPQV